MAQVKNERIFNQAVGEKFRLEAKKRTRWLSGRRRFLDIIADILCGERQGHYQITIQPDLGLILEQGTEKYWPAVEAVCDAVPGIRWTLIEFGGLGIRASTSG